MFNRKLGMEFKAAIAAMHSDFVITDDGQLTFRGLALHSRGSAETTKTVVANNIHFDKEIPLIHIQGDRLAIYTPEEIISLGKQQHGRETVNFAVKPNRQRTYTPDELATTLANAYGK